MTNAQIQPAEPAPTKDDIDRSELTATARRGSIVNQVSVAASSLIVQFSHLWSYRLAWCLVVAAHIGVVVAYDHEAYINTYILLGSKTEMAVQLLGLGASIRREIGVTLVVTNRLLMAWHVFGAAQAVLSSLWYRKLVFGLLPRKAAGRGGGGQQVYRPRAVSRLQRLLRCGMRAYRSTGARGKHFDTAFDVREAVEIVSQTVQAYSISCLITNDSVLHFVSLVLVLNCWSTPLIRLLFQTQEAKKRLVCLAVDAVFDFCCALAIPFLTFGLWEHQVATLDFYDAVWLIRSSTLLQYNLVNTWAGVFTTRLPALGLILALETLKSLLHRHGQSMQPTQAVARTASCVNEREPHKLGSALASKAGPCAVALPVKRVSRFTKIVDLVFFVYGLVILVLYTKAMAEPTIDDNPSSNCLLQLRPWGRRKAQCAVLDIDCARLRIAGSAGDMATTFETFDAGVIASLTVANCRALEMPPAIQKLKRLLHLEVYNSTIASWDASAALTRDHHPVLTGVFLVRVYNLQDGLPKGLLSPRFPPSLCVIQIAGGDLRALTSTQEDEEIVQTKWPQRMFVFTIEQSPLQEYPFVLLTKTITQTLSLSATNVSMVSSNAFVSAVGSTVVYLNDNPITSLPAAGPSASAGSSSIIVHMRNTQIHDIPSWLSALYTPSASPARFFASGTPLCAHATSSQSDFVDCTASTRTTQFPLEAYEAKRLSRAR